MATAVLTEDLLGDLVLAGEDHGSFVPPVIIEGSFFRMAAVETFTRTALWDPTED